MAKITEQPIYHIMCVLASVFGILFGSLLYGNTNTMLHMILLNIGLLLFFCVSIWSSKSRDIILAYGVTSINFFIAHFLLTSNLWSDSQYYWWTTGRSTAIPKIILGYFTSAYFCFIGLLSFKKINIF